MRDVESQRRRRASAGFTLTELLVATAIFGMLMAILIGVQLAAERQQDRGFRLVQANQHGRTGLDMIARDLRMAGSGFGNIPVYASFGGFPVPARYPVLPQPAAAAADSVEIIGSQAGGQSKLAAAIGLQTSPIQVDDASGFQVNAMVLLSDQNQGHLFQITSINGNTLEHSGATSPWNMGGAAGWPPFGYPSGVRVTQVEYVRYYVDTIEPAHPVLMRWRANESNPTFVAKDVEQLQFSYTEGDTVLPNPSDPLNIRKIAVNATTVAGSVLDGDNARRRLATMAVPRILE